MPIMGWIVSCGLGTGVAVWLVLNVPAVCARLSALPHEHNARVDPWEPTHTLVVQLLIAALQQGASIPHALRAVGECFPHAQAAQLVLVADALVQGVPWDDAWLGGTTDDANEHSEDTSHGGTSLLLMLAQALRSAWHEGASATQQLQAASEQLAIAERAHIEQTAASLSVRLLLPTGLCFLPALLCIGVVPTIMSFLQQ